MISKVTGRRATHGLKIVSRNFLSLWYLEMCASFAEMVLADSGLGWALTQQRTAF